MNRRLSIVVFFFATIFAILSCQSPTGGADMSLAPPDWIIGTWSDEHGINTCQFTLDNVIYSIDADGAVTIIDFREFYRDSGIVESSSETSYALTLAASSAVYEFSDNGDYTLDYYISMSGISTGPIMLFKE